MTVLAVDGGGSGFRCAHVLGTEVSNLRKTSGPLPDLEALLDFVRVSLTSDISTVAYAVAGVIEGRDLMVQSPNIRFLNGVRLASKTKEATGVPAVVLNDMEAAVMGMARLLPAEQYFLGITWSSGIGLRVWHQGKILSVAEGGHMVLDPSPFAPLCGCQRRGHAEAIIGGHAIRRRVVAETQARGIHLPSDREPCEFLDEAYQEGYEWADELYRVVAYGMGMFLADIQTLLHLPLIVWKGTVALKTWGFLFPRIRQAMRGCIIDPTWAEPNALRFLISPQPETDSLVGAAQGFAL